MDYKFSKDAVKNFILLLVIYLIICVMLVALHNWGICNFTIEMNSLDNIIFSLPMVALYLLVFLAATAGFARGKYMLEKLPLNMRLQQELKTRTMERANIKAKIRSGSQVKLKDSFSDALNNLVASRLSILAVIDNKNEVTGVLTSTDLLLYIQEKLKDNEENQLLDLHNVKVSDLKLSEPKAVEVHEQLQSVIETMIQHQHPKLIVTDKGKFSGTVDSLDILAELIEEQLC